MMFHMGSVIKIDRMGMTIDGAYVWSTYVTILVLRRYDANKKIKYCQIKLYFCICINYVKFQSTLLI